MVISARFPSLVMLVALAAVAASGAACARARAETVPDGPPLATPAPPPRVLAPVEEVLVEATPLPDPPVEPPRETSTTNRPAPRRPAVADTQKPTEPPAPVAAPVAAETAVRTPAPNPAEEKKISDVIARATRDLGNVDYRGLSENGKAQYDESKRFAELAASAVKERNYPQAATLADKAATIADQLLRQQ